MSKKFIIAGGGTGGHIFPALAIANAIKKMMPDATILFIGAKGKMEMEKVPQAGYDIVGLDIAGFNRSSLIKNIALPYKLVKSFFQVRSIFKKFRPVAVIGVGGYSTFPVLKYAQTLGIKTFIHESNSFAGKSNRMLAAKATKIFTGTAGMEAFFPMEKTMVSGNPVRESIAGSTISQADGLKHFSLTADRKTILVVGGSLGAKSINEAIGAGLSKLDRANLQLIWQTGKPFAARAKELASAYKNIWVSDFITEMQYAYAAADVVVSRSGAMSVAELCVAGKPVIFVPFPFAAEDHQTVNAMQLVNQQAAQIIKDEKASESLVEEVIKLASDTEKQALLKKNISPLAIRNADRIVAEEILKVI
jgi:UDP-N-acetylglucosamine--N-acetylmuramyl-(pentapeptide) pyrophosphoryl-undecaprenol N-acetylglucosamine transferase